MQGSRIGHTCEEEKRMAVEASGGVQGSIDGDWQCMKANKTCSNSGRTSRMGKEKPNHGSWRAMRMMGSRGRKENIKRDEERQLPVGSLLHGEHAQR